MNSFVWSHNLWKEAQQSQRHISRRLEGIHEVPHERLLTKLKKYGFSGDDFSDQLEDESDR